MGRRGPPPMPSEERKARGTYEKSRDRAAAVMPTTPGEPPMPPDLPEAARRRWTEVAPEMLKLGMLAQVDGGALEAYCREWARWKALQKDAAEHPRLKTPYGPKANPACAEVRKLHREVIQPLEAALGLTYSARCRMKAPAQTKDDDPVAKELFGELQAIPGGKAT